MKQLLLILSIGILLNPTSIQAQKIPAFSLRLSVLPQLSGLNPYDESFISNSERIIPSLAFGIEASKSLNEDLEIGPVLVKETIDNSLIAIDPTCTHAGCFVEWEDTENAFVCPCHQSKFEQDGTLIEGLAISDLIKYELKVESDIIWVASPLEGESM